MAEEITNEELPFRFFSTEDIIGACVVRVFAFVELLAVLGVAIEAFQDHVKKKAVVLTHIQLYYQIGLGLKALMMLVGTAATQKNDPYIEIWGAIGTRDTCRAQGTVMLFGLTASSAWDCVLTSTLLLIVKYGWRERRLRNLLKYAHAFCWTYATIWTAIPWLYDGYNNATYFCAAESYPPLCSKSLDLDLDIPCPSAADKRGIDRYHVAGFLTFVGLNMIYSAFCVMSIFLHVRHQGRRNAQYGVSSLELQQRRRPSRSEYQLDAVSHRVAVTGMMYPATFMFSVIPMIAIVILWDVLYTGFPHSLIPNCIAASMLSCFGIYNMVIFTWNRSVMRTRYGRVMKSIVDKIIDACCCYCSLSCWCLCCTWSLDMYGKICKNDVTEDESESVTNRPFTLEEEDEQEELQEEQEERKHDWGD